MKRLVADEFLSDPRIAEARKLLLHALDEHQRRLTAVRPPDPELKRSYEQAIEQFGEIRGGALYYPYLGSGIGRGALVELADGSVKYDMISGIGVHYLGHSHPLLVEAGFDAALGDTVMQGNLEQNRESFAFSDSLIDLATRKGAAVKHCFLTTSGAMANENALKLLFQKHSPANRILAFEHGFAGRTLALAQMTDKPAYRAGLPTTMTVDYVPFFDAAHPAESTSAAVAALKAHLSRYPKLHAAMWMELVLGEGGFYPGERSFFVALMEILKAGGVAVWADEIQTFGRTTQPFAFQHFDLDEYVDVVTVGKLTQVCATLFSDAYKPKPGLISQTFTGSTSAIRAGQAILEILNRRGLFGPEGRVAGVHNRFIDRLKAIGARHSGWINGPFGIGGMIAFTPLDGKEETAKKLLKELFDAGVIAFVAGGNPARVRFLPPVPAIADQDIDNVCEILEKVLEKIAVAA